MSDQSQPLWALVVALDLVDLTRQVVADLLGQSTTVRVLLIDQGSSEVSNDAFRQLAEQSQGRVLLWSYNPPLPSLSAAWNRGLGFCWATGASEALVVNSDVRLHQQTAETLRYVQKAYSGLFVTAVGVGAEQFAAAQQEEYLIPALRHDPLEKGGPDFSCFLLTREAHQRYPFDEGFIPAYGEDCDVHRRYLLAGDGARIFSINLPFHHIGGGSRTINQSSEARERFERLAGIGRAHYRAKWGGGPNAERFIQPYGPQGFDGVTLPELQARQGAGLPVLPPELPEERELTPEEATRAVELALTAKMEAIRAREA